MSEVYTVHTAEFKKSFEGKYGEMNIYSLLLHDGTTADLLQKPSSEPPKVGDEIEGTLETNSMGTTLKRVKKDFSGGSGKSGGNWSPKKEKEVAQLACLKISAEFLKMRVMLKTVEDVTNEDVWNHATLLREKVEGIQ